MIFSKSRKTHLLTTPGEDRDKDKHFPVVRTKWGDIVGGH